MTQSPAEHFHTTIKVTSDLRDRLKAQAAANGVTLGEQLAYLLELADAEARMDSIQSAIKATSPELMRSYSEEVEFWDSVSGF